MTDQDLRASVRRLYWLTASFGIIGFVWCFLIFGSRAAVAFALGAAGSFGNLRLFEWLSRAVAPGGTARKPWHVAAFIGRYLLLFLLAYAIVNSLGVNPLPVLLGLLASTAAVLASSILEIIQNLLGKQSTR